eukprot:TRINITY_DN4660_c0_g1_i5.p1 TRINITY_DN4660_c0_g1~~TRINITY_DN4660_c0_g1_i5.p1  ORF type:complete len:481 (-),score=76.35 TRINITY_DN4660_c0_g1_i5:55-1497(-)
MMYSMRCRCLRCHIFFLSFIPKLFLTWAINFYDENLEQFMVPVKTFSLLVKGNHFVSVPPPTKPVKLEELFAAARAETDALLSFIKSVKPEAVDLALQHGWYERGNGTDHNRSGKFVDLEEARVEADALLKFAMSINATDRLDSHLFATAKERRRDYFGRAYKMEFGPPPATIMHNFDKEWTLRRSWHCHGLLRDRTEKFDCSGLHSEEATRSVARECPASTTETRAPSPFLRSGAGESFCGSFGLFGREERDKRTPCNSPVEEFLGRTQKLGANQSAAMLESCPRCAVVGSSGNLLGSGLGPEIDMHDAVLRFNCAPTLGFSDDVGSKTTHRLVYPEASWFGGENIEMCQQLANLSAEGSNLLVQFFKSADIEFWADITAKRRPKGTGWKSVPTQLTGVPPERIATFAPSWIGYATAMADPTGKARVPTETRLSTGLVGMSIALQRCKQVNVYGFGRRDLDGQKLPKDRYKYYIGDNWS